MRIALCALLSLSAAAVTQAPPPGRGGARFLGAEAGMSGRVVRNSPYSADVVTESTQTLADGNRIRQTSNAKVYRDSEGRMRREQSVNLNGLSPNANMPQLVFINDPVAGASFALNASDGTATKSARNTWFTPGANPRASGSGRLRQTEAQ